MPWIQPSANAGLIDLLPASFIQQWENLACVTGQGDPFSCAPTWNLAYYDTFHGNRPVFYASDGRNALIFVKKETPEGIELLPVDDGWMFGQPLLGNGAPVLLMRHIPEIMADCQLPLRGIFISGIRRSDDLAKIIYECYGRIANIYCLGPWQNATASLAGGLDMWLENRSANFRANLKKAMRAGRRAGVIFEHHVPHESDWQELYGRMLAIEAESWKGLSGTGITHSPEKEFYRCLLKYMVLKGQGRVIFARIGEEDVGFIFGGILGDVYRGQQFSYRQKFSPFSIGNLLQFEQIKWLMEEGIIHYELGSGTGSRMDYKNHWAEDYRDMESWLITTRPLSLRT